MSQLTPLQPLYEASVEHAGALPLPSELARLYGMLQFPATNRPYVIGNFVATLDGVVTLNMPGRGGLFNANTGLVQKKTPPLLALLDWQSFCRYLATKIINAF